MNNIKRIVKELEMTGLFDVYERKARNYYLWFIAVDVFEQLVALDEIEDRLLCISVPVFEKKTLEANDITLLPINKQIEHYHMQGLSVRQISKQVNKTYTRVKNVVKVLRARDI
jgi:hypothetical protein